MRFLPGSSLLLSPSFCSTSSRISSTRSSIQGCVMADNEKHVSERGHSRGKVIARRFLRHKLGVAGISVVLLLALVAIFVPMGWPYSYGRSEEHTTELQSRGHIV